jgi:hypothetical protein
LVIKAPTTTLNPTIDPAIIERARADDPTAAASEWDAEFRTDISALLTDDVIDRAVDQNRPMEFGPRRDRKYFCFVDASGGMHDAFTCCVGHVEGDGDDSVFVADVVRGRPAPFDPASMAREYADLARRYGCSEVTGDAYAGEWTAAAFRDAGIAYVKSDLAKSGLYLESLPMFAQGRVSLPNHEKLLRELRLLERRTARSGRDSVDHGPTGSDDLANALAGCLWLSGLAGHSRGEFSVGINVGMGKIEYLDQYGHRERIYANDRAHNECIAGTYRSPGVVRRLAQDPDSVTGFVRI